MMLGEALMQIDEHEEAMKAFEVAKKKSPQDAAVANQVGQTLVAMHEYKKAIEHYNDALIIVKESPAKLELLYNLGGSIFTNQYFECGFFLCALKYTVLL